MGPLGDLASAVIFDKVLVIDYAKVRGSWSGEVGKSFFLEL